MKMSELPPREPLVVASFSGYFGDRATALDEAMAGDPIHVLIGDYEQVAPRMQQDASAPLVHIRAIPEGGTPAARRAMQRKYDPRFPRTFYSRYQPADAPRLDGRQPLPSVFTAHWTTDRTSHTFFKIWREGKSGRNPSCAAYDDDNVVKIMDAVVFDEAENPAGLVAPPSYICTPIPWQQPAQPTTSLTAVNDSSFYPRLDNGATSGWLYLNLDNCQLHDWASSNWVLVSLRAEGRFAHDVAATALGNGCSPDTPATEISNGNEVLGPRP